MESQRLLQAASDIVLGWIRTTGFDGVERLLFPPAVGPEGRGPGRDDEPAIPGRLYAQLCGWTLAKAHARSGDAIAIGSYLGATDALDRALASFAETYADQTERDYA